MNISIISVFPELYNPFLQTSLIKRAQDRGLVTVNLSSFFSYVPAGTRIDAPTFGPGDGMLIKPEVVEKAIMTHEQQHGPAYKIFFSPHGKKLDQDLLVELARTLAHKHVLLVAGRYEGMDARVEEEYADSIISLGDFVLMAGDLPAMVFLEGILRLLPGVVGKPGSVEHESFTGPFVDYPEYTEPVDWKGSMVPDIVRSGNHAAIAQWREQQAIARTLQTHFDWLRKQPLTAVQQQAVTKAVPAHYLVLMHDQVMVGRQERVPGTTSVTSLDIHDIARSARTYGIREYFLVTPLKDQQNVVTTLLDFWQQGVGIEYNKQRHEAVKTVRLAASFAEVIAKITEREGVAPLVIATSARAVSGVTALSFDGQGPVWALGRPILFVFGTGQGLDPHFIAQCDFILPPVGGLGSWRHLSVRSAVAVVLDRWMGSYEKVHVPSQ